MKMKQQKIIDLLHTTFDKVPKFITKKWVDVNDQTGSAENRYKSSKQIRFKKSMLQSDLCDFSDAYIIVKGTITVTDPNNNAYDTKLAFKDNAPFISCISKINNALIDNAEDFDIVMSMYNLLEYCKNYSKTTGTFSNYYRDYPNSGVAVTIKWNKYRSEMTNQTKNNNLHYLREKRKSIRY